MRAESAPVRVLGKCPAFEAVVMAARVVVMRAPLPNLRNNDKCNYRLLFRGYQRELPPRPLRACPMGHPADQIPPSLGAPAVRMDGGAPGRVIPAWAGNTLQVMRPRLYESGSSPRGRGTHSDGARCAAAQRVYPRACGETGVPAKYLPQGLSTPGLS